MSGYLKLLILVLVTSFLSSAFADDQELAACGSQADQKLKAVLQSVSFSPLYIQVGKIDRIERLEFRNTTPGTYQQEYVGTYRLTYKNEPYAQFREQEIRVQFLSPFICDHLKVTCLDVVLSTPARGVDPAALAKTGPLVCEPGQN